MSEFEQKKIMAKLSAHGTMVGEFIRLASKIRFMSDKYVLINRGSGWKKWRKVKQDRTPEQVLQSFKESQEKTFREHPNYAVYFHHLHTFPFKLWGSIHAEVKDHYNGPPNLEVLLHRLNLLQGYEKQLTLEDAKRIAFLYSLAKPDFDHFNEKARGPQLPKNLTVDQIIAAVEKDDNLGFCIACGEEAFSVEPDARQYKCESCGERKVYGAEELLIMFG